MDINNFDPDGPGVDNGNYFGLPFGEKDASLVIISVPWDVTTSYGDGTSGAPEAIIDASLQVDLFDMHNHSGWRSGIATLPLDAEIAVSGAAMREQALKVIVHLEAGGSADEDYVKRKLRRVNTACSAMNDYVYDQSRRLLDAGKKVCVVGGDHSVPLGLIKALSEREPGFGILHIDAHADLREAYEGFTYSHASIMYNALKEADGIRSLVQVGIRDLGQEEYELAGSDGRIVMFDDYSLNDAKFRGENWSSVCDRIVAALPDKVYVSFDIDGLTPDNCPGTGTPVPGGLSFHEAVYLVNRVRGSGRDIIGFDLCEVSPSQDNDFDANVGARVLYKLCNIALKN